MCLYREQIQLNCHKTCILFILGAFYCPSGRFLSISSKSNNLNFDQLSLNLTHCAPEWKLMQTPDALNGTWDRRVTFPSLVQGVYLLFMSSMLGCGFVHVSKTCGYCTCLLVSENRMLPKITLCRLPKYGAQGLFYRVFLNGWYIEKTNPRVDQCKLGVYWYNITNKHSCFSEQCYFRNMIVHDAYLKWSLCTFSESLHLTMHITDRSDHST